MCTVQRRTLVPTPLRRRLNSFPMLLNRPLSNLCGANRSVPRVRDVTSMSAAGHVARVPLCGGVYNTCDTVHYSCATVYTTRVTLCGRGIRHVCQCVGRVYYTCATVWAGYTTRVWLCSLLRCHCVRAICMLPCAFVYIGRHASDSLYIYIVHSMVPTKGDLQYVYVVPFLFSCTVCRYMGTCHMWFAVL